MLNNGCGSVWSSGSVLPRLGLVVFDTADCNFSNAQNLSDSILALHIDNGHLAWVYRPPLPGIDCDWDFGSSVNAGVTAHGDTTFLGAGSKDGTYYSLDPATGHLRWKTNVVFGGFSGGFIATTAYDGHHVYGSTAAGDFGRFEKGTQILCDPGNPRDTAMQQPTVHAFNATTGAVTWQADNAASFAPTTVAGGMTFNGPAFDGASCRCARRPREDSSTQSTFQVRTGPARPRWATPLSSASDRPTPPSRPASSPSPPGGCIRSLRQGTPLRRTVLELDEAFPISDTACVTDSDRPSRCAPLTAPGSIKPADESWPARTGEMPECTYPYGK